MDAVTIAVCAALYTGFVWGAGALSTWLAVEPMRRKLDVLEAWRDRVCEMGRQANEASADWAGRVETALAQQAEVLRGHHDCLQELRDSALTHEERIAGAEGMARRLWLEAHPECLLRQPAQKGSGQAVTEDFSPKA